MVDRRRVLRTLALTTSAALVSRPRDLLARPQRAHRGKGHVLASEKRSFREPSTNVSVIQLTNFGCINKKSYYNQQQFIRGAEQFVFSSNRAGTHELYLVEVASGKIVQLTEGNPRGTDEISGYTVDPQTGVVYFPRHKQVIALDSTSLKEEVLFEAPDGQGQPSGFGLSSCGRYLVFACSVGAGLSGLPNLAYRHGSERIVVLYNLEKRKHAVIYHPNYAPNQPFGLVLGA